MKKTIICPDCDGHGFINGGDERSSWSRSCARCHGTGYDTVPMTMADRVRSMNDAELVAFCKKLMNLAVEDSGFFCQQKKECTERLNNFDAAIPEEWCEKCLLEWFQKPLEDVPRPVGICEDKQESGLIEED